MITQYSWVSIKEQQRKHLEIGAILTLLVFTLTFLAIPKFSVEAPPPAIFKPEKIEVLSVPPTQQKMDNPKPERPAIITADEDEDIDEEFIPEELFGGPEWGDLEKPEPPAPPTVFLDPHLVSDRPAPIGGYAAIVKGITYPPIAREAGTQGIVTVLAYINKKGVVERVEVQKGYPDTGLDEEAMRAIKATAFTPAMQMGKPVAVKIAIPVNFRLR